jgi:hypothetical protein
LYGTAEELAEKVKKQIPRGLKSARDDKNKGLNGTTKSRALIQNVAATSFSATCKAVP